MVHAGSDLDSCCRYSCMSAALTRPLGEGITRLIAAFATWFDPRARRQCYTVFHAQDGEHGSPLWFWQVFNNAIRQYRFQGVMEPDDFYENSGFYLGWKGSNLFFHDVYFQTGWVQTVRADQEMYMMSFDAFREERLGQF